MQLFVRGNKTLVYDVTDIPPGVNFRWLKLACFYSDPRLGLPNFKVDCRYIPSTDKMETYDFKKTFVASFSLRQEDVEFIKVLSSHRTSQSLDLDFKEFIDMFYDYETGQYKRNGESNTDIESDSVGSDDVYYRSETDSEYEEAIAPNQFQLEPTTIPMKTKIFSKALADEFLELCVRAGETIECVVCTEEIKENLIITECSHKICTDCFLKTNQYCVLCRQDLHR